MIKMNPKCKVSEPIEEGSISIEIKEIIKSSRGAPALTSINSPSESKNSKVAKLS